MMITCPSCSAHFQAPDNIVGKKAKCGECKQVFIAAATPVAEVVPPELSKTMDDIGATHPEEHAYASWYFGLAALLLLLVRGGSAGHWIVSLLMTLAMESAAIFLAYRGLLDAQRARRGLPHSPIARAGFFVNVALLILVGLSVLLTLYQFIASQSGGSTGGIPDMGNILKTLNQQQNQMTDLLKGIK